MDGEHQIVVEDTMTTDDVWEFEGEVIDLLSRSWNCQFDYAYTFANFDTACVKLGYVEKVQSAVADTAIYRFDDSFCVDGASMFYSDKGTTHTILYVNLENQNSSDEVQCRGTEVRHFLDSLITHPVKRKIFMKGGGLCVE